MSAAARKDDPIEHSSALGGLLTGLAIGAAVAVAGVAIVGTGGLAAVAIVGAGAALGAGIGELIGSLSFCTSQAGKIIEGSANVFINGLAAARAHLSTVACDKHSGLQRIAEGSSTVFINGQPAARVKDRSTCDGKISAGSPNVFIGGGTQPTDEIDPEVPGWLHAAVFGIGIGSAVLLGAGPGLIVLGLAGGLIGGAGGQWLGGKIWGEGSDGQKLMALGGTMLGGFIGGKGGQAFDARYQVKIEGLGANLGNIKISPKNNGLEKGASFGTSTSKNYKKTFFEANPEVEGKVVVHHAVEQQVQIRYPDLVTDSEMHSINNLRGIPKESNPELHLSKIRKEWNNFYRTTPNPTKQQLLDKATEIDDKFGKLFNPPVRD